METKVSNDIIERAKNGDIQAFDDIYKAYREKLYYYIVSKGAAQQDAEDIVSDTFLEAMKHIGDLKNNDHLLTWLHSIAKNKLYAASRKEGRHTRVDLFGSDTDGNDESVTALEKAVHRSAELEGGEIMLPEDHAENEDIKEILAGAVNSLNDNQREAIFLFYHRDKTLEQVAKLTGVSVNTVKSRIYQARSHLQKYIGELQSRGVVFSLVPVSMKDMLKSIDGRVKVSSGMKAPTVITGVSAKGIAVAAVTVVVGTGVVVSLGLNSLRSHADHDVMDNRPEINNEYSEPDDSIENQAVIVFEDYDADDSDYTEDNLPAKTNDNVVIRLISDNDAPMAGDTVKYDVIVDQKADTSALQFHFVFPEGVEFVSFDMNEDVIKNDLAFDDWDFSEDIDQETFIGSFDYQFMAYKTEFNESEAGEYTIATLTVNVTKDQPGEIAVEGIVNTWLDDVEFHDSP